VSDSKEGNDGEGGGQAMATRATATATATVTATMWAMAKVTRFAGDKKGKG
jgi:hypothetical protein